MEKELVQLMNFRPSIRVMDATLRDGGLVNDFYFKDGNLIRVDGSDAFDSVYMKYLLEHLISEYKKQMSSGTAYAALTISGLTKMKVYDVPMNLQIQFSDFVKQVDKSKVAVQKSLDETRKLFDSLMQEYFG